MDGQTIDPFKKTVDPEKLKNCLMTWAFKTKEGKSHQIDFVLGKKSLKGFAFSMMAYKLDDPAGQGGDFLEETRYIMENQGLNYTYSVSREYYGEIEINMNIKNQTVQG